jgi:hypothetical protein
MPLRIRIPACLELDRQSAAQASQALAPADAHVPVPHCRMRVHAAHVQALPPVYLCDTTHHLSLRPRVAQRGACCPTIIRGYGDDTATFSQLRVSSLFAFGKNSFPLRTYDHKLRSGR